MATLVGPIVVIVDPTCPWSSAFYTLPATSMVLSSIRLNVALR